MCFNSRLIHSGSGVLKLIFFLRMVMQGILPDSVLRKKKMGFNPPLPEWINRELKPMIRELLSPAAVARRGMFRPEAVERLLKEHFQGGRDNAIKIWGLLMLEVWHQMYIDRVPDASAQFLLAASGTKRAL